MNNISVKEMLQDQDPYVRRDACYAVSDSRDGKHIPDLVDILNDENAGVKEAALNALVAIGGRQVAEAVSPMLRCEDVSLRNVAVEILQQIGSEGLDILSKMLYDPDDDVVKFAVDIIAQIKEAEGVKLLGPLVKHSNPNVRGSVAVCLGRIEANGAASILMELLGDDEEWVQFSAVEGLGFLKDPAAVRPLIELIEKESGLVREAAIDAVSKIAAPDDALVVLKKIGALITAGHVVSTSPVVDLISKATGCGNGAKLPAELEDIYYNFCAGVMERDDAASAMKAVKGLAMLRRTEGLRKIFALAESFKEIDEDTSAELVEAVVAIVGHRPLPAVLTTEIKKVNNSFAVIVEALGILRSEDAVPVLEELMYSVGKEEMRQVVSAIEAIGSMASVNAFYNALKSTDGHTRKTAARALASLAGESSVPCLFEALKGETFRDVQEEITDVLSFIPSGVVKDGFCDLLLSSDNVMREMGARGLGMMGDEEALESLKKAVTDSEPAVRKAAYKSMAKLGIPDAIELVIEGLKDSHDDVKLSVLKALGGWNGDRIVEALLEAVKDENMWIRYHAVNLLGDLAEPSTFEILEDLLVNDEPPVKAAAASALGKCGSVGSIKVLEKLSDHPDPKVMEAIHEAIESLKCLL